MSEGGLFFLNNVGVKRIRSDGNKGEGEGVRGFNQTQLSHLLTDYNTLNRNICKTQILDKRSPWTLNFIVSGVSFVV